MGTIRMLQKELQTTNKKWAKQIASKEPKKESQS
jgi:hypothetical protein